MRKLSPAMMHHGGEGVDSWHTLVCHLHSCVIGMMGCACRNLLSA